jgi:hypothetical protein
MRCLLRRIAPSALALGAVTTLAAAAPSAAQAPALTLPDMALKWSLGSFASPLICELEGRPVRGLRRVEITSGPTRIQPPVNRIRFIDMEVEDASRCFVELAGDTPNVTGSLHIRLLGSHSPDAAQRDFRESLRRRRGFEFTITKGVLQIQEVAQPAPPPRAVDFSRGRAKLSELPDGSDTARLLAPFPSPRKLQLELEARDGTTLSFPLYLSPPH